MKTIQVRMPKSMLAKLGGSEVNLNVLIIQSLKAAKVPVIGAISVQGVRYGKLTSYSENADFVYDFDEGEEDL